MSRADARVLIAGTSSGVGKTTVATGLMAALRARGVRVTGAKVGPDFIDPGYHAIATGRPSRNLDPWICGEDAIPALMSRAADGELLVVEGAMGLFDGSEDSTDDGSSAHVARLTRTPVILVVDASAIAGSVAALIHGYASFDPRVHVAGIILNRVGSDGHEVLLRASAARVGLPVLGALREDVDVAWRERHLGLVPIAESPQQVSASLDRLVLMIERWCDVESIVALAQTAPPLDAATPRNDPRHIADVRIAVATGRAFSFMYADNVEALHAAGAEVVPFDPLTDPRLPESIDGVYVGGGFPEIYAGELGANTPMIEDARRHISAGTVTLAECGGLLWLSRSCDGIPMVGALPADARMTEHLSIGYRMARARVASPIASVGTTLRGHEFHRSICAPGGDALQLEGRFGRGPAGFASASMLGSYVHFMFASDPTIAENFVAAAACARDMTRASVGR